MKTPYRVIAERDSYEDNMTSFQKFKSLIHTNSYTKSITTIGIIVFPMMSISMIGRIFLLCFPPTEGEDRHLITDQFNIWVISFFIGLSIVLMTFVVCTFFANWKNITNFIVNVFFPKNNI